MYDPNVLKVGDSETVTDVSVWSVWILPLAMFFHCILPGTVGTVCVSALVATAGRLHQWVPLMCQTVPSVSGLSLSLSVSLVSLSLSLSKLLQTWKVRQRFLDFPWSHVFFRVNSVVPESKVIKIKLTHFPTSREVLPWKYQNYLMVPPVEQGLFCGWRSLVFGTSSVYSDVYCYWYCTNWWYSFV